MPLDYYYRLKNLLKLIKETEYTGVSNFTDKICIFVCYPYFGTINKQLRKYIESIALQGYSIVLISNSSLENETIEDLKSLCTKILVRENYGKDFGAYKCGIMKFKEHIINAKTLLIANDSVIQILNLKDMFAYMNTQDCDFWGVSEAYHDGIYKNHHICSYFIAISQKVLESKEFWQFWENYHNSNSRMRIISSGEIGFSAKMNSAGFKSASFVNSADLYKFLYQKQDNLADYINLNSWIIKRNNIRLEFINIANILYSTNLNVTFFKAMIELKLPVIKKDIFSKCLYKVDDIKLLLQNKKIENVDEIIKELTSQIRPSTTLKDRILLFIGEK